jgi:hypothetical protein
MFSKKKILIIVFSVLVVSAVFVAAFFYRSKITPIGQVFKKAIISVVPEWRRDDCINNFDVKKTINKDKIGSDDELEQLIFNSIVAEAFLNSDASKCASLKASDESKSLLAVNNCQFAAQDIHSYYDFAEKLKNKMPEEDFINYCRSFLLDQSLSFKANVPENFREQRSKSACQSIYLSYQNKEIVFNDSFFYEESQFPDVPACNCVKADGNQGSCKSGFCNIMGFFAAASKNDQSLCPRLSDVKDFPYCNLYFDKQAIEKYNDILKERYCQKI